ncbi:MAG: type II toxin-antitoxin system RelE/ParE family toxin [Chloroflexi bacterium]|jgi:mRNA-degrading endonuclease RelE of RelBE toxin-antitoxin system|nr:type II toxin-antitoxin system RelE/ParE family toxin [Chloroflexota bacterium]
MKIELSKQAQKYFSKCPANVQQRFERMFEGILNGEGDIQKYGNEKNQFRYKIFHYRAIFAIDKEANVIRIIKIGTRTDIYK